MGFCNSVRECAISRPPLAVFAASIAAFALTLIVVSIYIESHRTQLLDPDVKDWNSFFDILSQLEICLPQEEIEKDSHERLLRKKRDKTEISDWKKSLTLNKKSLLLDETVGNLSSVTLSVKVDAQVLREGLPITKVRLHVAALPAKHLGLRRDPSSLELMLGLPTYIGGNACLTLTGPPHLLPTANITPPACSQPLVKEMTVLMADPWMAEVGWCSSGRKASLTLAQQHTLNVYLTQGDVNLIQLHLAFTTCLLCLMVVVLLCCAVCRRVTHRTKAPVSIQADKVPLAP